MKRVLVTGALGMLGHKLVEMAPDTWTTIEADLEEFNITIPEEVDAFIDSVRPDVLINCAAMTDVDGCESEIDKAMSINGDGPGYLAAAARRSGSPILHVSSDYVFDGEKEGEYIEDDPVNPTSVYGRSKLAGEESVREANPGHWLVRTQWLYGPGGGNFVDTMLRLSAERSELHVVNDQFGCLTYAVDLAAQIIRIVEQSPPHGVYHCSNNGSASWFEVTRRILDLSGRQHVKLLPITSKELDRPARRPHFSVLRNRNLANTIGDGMRPWEEALAEFVASVL